VSGEPVSLTGCLESDPGLYLLPIRCEARSASLPPEPVEYWRWVPAASGSVPGRWVRVVVAGE
jgi:hypothetical protein